jgi:DNA-binding transcriptional MerR regulator
MMQAQPRVLSEVRKPPRRIERVNRNFYGVPELTHLSGLSRTQIATLEKKHVLTAHHRAETANDTGARFYLEREALKVLLISDMRKSGLSLREATSVVLSLDAHGLQLDSPEKYLLTDGHALYYARNAEDVVDIHTRHGRKLLLLAIGDRGASLRAAKREYLNLGA